MDDAPGRSLFTGVQGDPRRAGDFMSLCKNAELACEVTLQPLRRYALDAAILFSDILTIPDAMGLGLYFEAGEGPRFSSPLPAAPTSTSCRCSIRKWSWAM